MNMSFFIIDNKVDFERSKSPCLAELLKPLELVNSSPTFYLNIQAANLARTGVHILPAGIVL